MGKKTIRDIYIKRLDGVYDVGKIKPYETPEGKVFVIEAEDSIK